MWFPLFALPNAKLSTPIDGGSTIGLWPSDDPRLTDAWRDSPEAAQFFRSFQTPMGAPVTPAALVVDMDRRQKPLREVVAFRNAVATSALTQAWAVLHEANSPPHPLYSDALDLYPATIGYNGSLIWRTAGNFGSDRVAGFSGRTGFQFPYPEHQSIGIDQTLFRLLRQAWSRNYTQRRGSPGLRRIFRALDMAVLGARSPMANQGHHHDCGTAVGLWVSALEVLSYGNRANFQTVANLLQDHRWQLPDTTSWRGAPVQRFGQPWTERPIVFYDRVYRLRNDILHGNPFRERRWTAFFGTAIMSPS